MRLKLPQLDFFCALVETGSLSAAADKMYTVPSNITARIKELEETLGIALVSREKQRLIITPEGRVFYGHAQSLLVQSQQCQNLFRQEALTGELRIGGLDVSMSGRLQSDIANFMSNNPRVTIDVACDSSISLMENLLGGELDVIVVDGPVQHPTVKAKFFSPESLFIVTHSDTIQNLLAEVPRMTMFTFGEKCFYHLLIKQWLDSHQLNAKKHAQSSHMILF